MDYGLIPPTAEFSTSSVLVRAEAGTHFVGLMIDSLPVSTTLHHTNNGLMIPLPPSVRDSLPHAVEVVLEVGGMEVTLREEMQSHYIGNLERVDDQVSGWIYDTSDPHRSVVLEVVLDDVMIGTCVTGIERQDVTASGHAAKRPGFDMQLPQRSLTAPAILSLRVAGTGCAPFGSKLIGVTAASYGMLANTVDNPVLALLHDRVAMPALLAVARGHAPTLSVPIGAVALAPRAQERMGPPVIDVVIPVYRGIEETLACVESVIAGQARIAANIVVIFDRGPEPELAESLAALGEAGEILYLENAKNLGFVGTVNRGMRHTTTNDVVLLNSDTVVPPGWLDRLYAAAHADERIGTVSAMSNNATICSLPHIGGMDGLPYQSTLEDIDRTCARVNAGVTVDLPTAHGFCMYIKRRALEDVGFFDAEAFGRGYGEENDFSLRAATRGWRNVVACDVFVQHKGSVSFQASAEEQTQKNLRIIDRRYPDYHRQVVQFTQADPLHAARNRVQPAFWQGRDAVVLISLAIGGGVGRHIDEAAARLEAQGLLVLLFSRAVAPSPYAWQLCAWRRPEERLVYPAGPRSMAQAMSDIVALGPHFLHIHHLIDLDATMAAMVMGSGLPYQVTLHDFFHICPRVTLLDESATYCGAPDAAKCTRCISRAGPHPALHPSMANLAADVAHWRTRWAGFLAGAAQVLAPSADTASHYGRILPDLAITVHPHEIAAPLAPAWQARPQPALIKVVVVGAIGPHKGVEQLLALVRHAERWAGDLHFIIVGFTSQDDKLASFANATITGSYAQEELAALLARHGGHVALFLSPWPETYSYTLSEALAHGLTPVTYQIGAIAERLNQLGCGVQRPVDTPAAEMIEAIRIAAGQATNPIGFTVIDPPLPLEGQPAQWPPRGRQQSPALLLQPATGCFTDGWVERSVVWHFHSTMPLEQLELEFWAPAQFAGQHVTVRVNGSRIAREPIRPDDLTCLLLHLHLRPGLVEISCHFDFDAPPDGSDQRRCSAVLAGLVLRAGSKTSIWRPSGEVSNPDRSGAVSRIEDKYLAALR